jgi:hypothetical protein
MPFFIFVIGIKILSLSEQMFAIPCYLGYNREKGGGKNGTSGIYK